MDKRRFYLIAPLRRTGKDMLTYHADQEIQPGALVAVPLGKKQVLGVVFKATTKPAFKTKQVLKIIKTAPLPDYLLEISRWIAEYYAASLPQVLHMMVPDRPHVKSTSLPRYPTGGAKFTGVTKLHNQQSAAINDILGSRQKQFLLHGVTGSGKTKVYIELTKNSLAGNRSVIVLVPEIALTSQVVGQFQEELGKVVLTTHSGMSNKERRAVWQKVQNSDKPYVVIGPRSALFTPLKSIGLIIVDECHETSYKQDQAPRYHATAVAAQLAKINSARLVLGSATPSAQDVFLSQHDKLKLVRMDERIHVSNRAIEIISLKETKGVISPELKNALERNLEDRGISILFLNRRGSASQVICADCGWVALCKHCQIPQTFHGDEGKLRCHWCGYQRVVPASCPDCNGLRLRFLGVGTKRVESEVKKLFPGARVARLDRDSFSPKTIAEFMQKLYKHEVDILIGTQMVAKGLDIPGVTLVGVVLADTMLHIPDYTASERTFQLLYQVIGRGGRSTGAHSKTIIQTYSPDSPAIVAAAAGTFDEFIKSELSERQALGFPPYKYLLKLECVRKTRKSAQEQAQKLKQQLEREDGFEVLGPAPSFKEQVGGAFHWQLILKSSKRSNLVKVNKTVAGNWRIDLDPVDLL